MARSILQCRTVGILLSLVLLTTLTSAASTTDSNLLQKAREQYQRAQQLETALNAKAAESRSRAEYVKVITAYQRVYLITPKTGYADNALVAVAKLYEQIGDTKNAVKTLTFLVREYPSTPFRKGAESDLVRLAGTADKADKTDKTVSEKTVVAENVAEKAPEKEKKPVSNSSIENIRYWEAPNSVRVVVDLSEDVPFKQGEAKDPDRVFIDIAPARLNTSLIGKQWPVQSGLLQQIRVGQYDNSTVRVVLDVGTMDRVTSFTLHDPDRLIIDVLGKGAVPVTHTEEAAKTEAGNTPAPVAAAPVTTAPAPAPAASMPAPPPAAPAKTAAAKNTPAKLPATKAPATKSVKASEPTVESNPDTDAKVASVPDDMDKIVTPAKPLNNRDQSLIRSLGLKLQRVVIDPGHGGHDTGTIGPGGYTEKDLVLDVAKRLKELIETNLGAEVVMTRNDDTFIPLETRTALANQHQADLFISIHANSSHVTSVRGVETFFLNLTNSREALDTASRENAAASHSIHELQDIVKKIMLSDKVEESRELAELIQKSMVARKNSGTNRGVKQAPFVVLLGANMPSILTEIGFISNPAEEKNLRAPDTRQLIAESIFQGVRSYADTLSGLKTAAKVPDQTKGQNKDHK